MRERFFRSSPECSGNHLLTLAAQIGLLEHPLRNLWVRQSNRTGTAHHDRGREPPAENVRSGNLERRSERGDLPVASPSHSGVAG